jgi:hypothetical protein
MDAFVRRMSPEELAAQREKQSEEHDIFLRTVLRPRRETTTQKRRAADAERQRRKRARTKSEEIILGIRNTDGTLNRSNATSNRVRMQS